jgi:histidine triad (HIT) family protein
MECTFCRIIAGQIPADVVFQDQDFLAFWDIHPQAPKHILIVPKLHITSIADVTEKQLGLMGRLMLVAKEVAEKENISTNGYRLTINCGADGGQLVPHLHLHVLGGRRLGERMG